MIYTKGKFPIFNYFNHKRNNIHITDKLLELELFKSNISQFKKPNLSMEIPQKQENVLNQNTCKIYIKKQKPRKLTLSPSQDKDKKTYQLNHIALSKTNKNSIKFKEKIQPLYDLSYINNSKIIPQTARNFEKKKIKIKKKYLSKSMNCKNENKKNNNINLKYDDMKEIKRDIFSPSILYSKRDIYSINNEIFYSERKNINNNTTKNYNKRIRSISIEDKYKTNHLGIKKNKNIKKIISNSVDFTQSGSINNNPQLNTKNVNNKRNINQNPLIKLPQKNKYIKVKEEHKTNSKAKTKNKISSTKQLEYINKNNNNNISNIQTKELIKYSSRNSQSTKITNASTNHSSKFSNPMKSIYKITHISKPGERNGIPKANQDTFFISSNSPLYTLVGVCDGHGKYGHLISTFIKENLPHTFVIYFKEKFPSNSNSPSLNPSINYNNSIISNILEATFLTINSKLSNNANIDSNFSGSTCIAVLFLYNEEEKINKIYISNVGDSRAIVIKRSICKWTFEYLSRDHSAKEKDEASRILRFGGRIEKFRDDNGDYVGPLRVWLKNGKVPGLSMTRSFGDQIAASVGVLTEPEIKEYIIKEEDKCIVIASDGIWEYLSSQDVCDIIQKYYNKNKTIDGVENELYKKAFFQWRRNTDGVDDITIMVVIFD